MKTLTTLLILIITLPCVAQPYVALGLQNKGFNMSSGIVSPEGVDIGVQFKTPLSMADQASILSMTIGKQINFNEEEDGYSITPQIGGGWLRVKDFTLYDKDPVLPVIQRSYIRPVYGIELNKDSYMGRMSLVVKYIDKVYYGVTMKVFLWRYTQ
jgi:hypothetical protein